MPDLQDLKQRIPLLDYLRQRHWTDAHRQPAGVRRTLPVPSESRPSFYVNRARICSTATLRPGGDLIRFVSGAASLLPSELDFLQRHIAAAAGLADVLRPTAVL